MNETPTPPEGYRIIPRAYLEAGNPLPGDALVRHRQSGSQWWGSSHRGLSILNGSALDVYDYATAQPLPCFQSPDQGPEHNPDGLTPEQYGAPEWRLLREGERKKPTDEFWYCMTPNRRWATCDHPGDELMNYNTYRRRVAPEPTAGIAEPFGKIDMALRIAELERERDEARAERDEWRKANFENCLHRDKVCAQLAASEKDRQWRPIENAPKDGTKFLIWEVDFKAHRIAWWRKHRGTFGDDCYQYNFAHWLPLRVAPTQSETL